jgi:hypothetical protein
MTDNIGREAAIRGLTEYRKELLRNLKIIEETIGLLGGPTETPEPAVVPKESQIPMGGPQRVVIDFLRRSPGQFFRPREVARQITKQGFKPNSPKVWPTQVTNCLRRAVEKGIAGVRETDGRKEYGLKQEVEVASNQDNQENSLS